jgi:NADPH2:quinone reductase
LVRAVVCHEFGPYETLQAEDVPAPDLADDGVLIDVHAAGVSFATSLVVAGKYQRLPPRPFSPGTEVAGVVRRVAHGVDRVLPGEKVFAAVDWGGHAGQCAAHAINVQKIPDGMDFPAATTFALSYPTAYGALVWRANIKAGETLRVHGAAGAIGLAAVEIGKALGAQVIAVAGGPEKAAMVKEHGADDVIDHQKDDFRAVSLDITKGRGVDVIFDSIGGDVTKQSIRSLAMAGRLLTVGFASGTIPEVPANLFLLKNISMLGFNYGTYIGWSPQDERERYGSLVDEMHRRLALMYEAGKLRPVVSRHFALDEFKDALDNVMGRKVIGKCVIEPDDEDRD